MSETHTLYAFSGGRGKVWASYADDGSLQIESYDPCGIFDDGTDYEFVVTVRTEHFDLLRAGLGGVADADVLDLVVEHGEVVGKHTTSFLGGLKVPYEIWSWLGS